MMEDSRWSMGLVVHDKNLRGRTNGKGSISVGIHSSVVKSANKVSYARKGITTKDIILSVVTR